MIIKTTGMRELLAELGSISENLPKEAYAALSEAAKKTKSKLVKVVAGELNVKQKIIRQKVVTINNRRATSVTVKLMESARIPLRDFSASKNKKGFVTAKISRREKRKVYDKAFVINKFGDHVFVRNGKDRKIYKLHGASPWGVLVKDEDKVQIILEAATDLIEKEMAERIRVVNLRNDKKLNWQ